MPNTFQGFPTVPRLPWDDLYFSSWFESLDGFSAEITGTGTKFLDSSQLTLSTGLNAGSTAFCQKVPALVFPILTWAKNREFRTTVTFKAEKDINCEFYVGTGLLYDGRHLFFIVLNGILYAQTSDGTEKTRVQLEEFVANPFEVTRRLKIIFTAGSSAQFYVDDVLKATITTTLPATAADSENVVIYWVNNTAANKDVVLKVSLFSVWQEY